MYKGIDDMPQGAFRRLEKKSDLTLLFADPPKKLKRSQKKAARERHQLIKDEKFDEIDMNDELELHILKMVDREILRTEYLIKPDNHLLTLIMKLDMEIEAETKKGDSSDKRYYENKAHISKYMGFNIDENAMSIREFHANITIMNAESDRIAAANLHKGKKY